MNKDYLVLFKVFHKGHLSSSNTRRKTLEGTSDLLMNRVTPVDWTIYLFTLFIRTICYSEMKPYEWNYELNQLRLNKDM